MRLVRYTYPTFRSFGPSYAARSPWSGLDAEISRLFDTAVAGLESAGSSARFPVDLYEDKDNVYVRAALPGVNRDEIGVEFADSALTITAERKPAPATSEANAEAAPAQPAAEPETFSFSRSVGIAEDVQADKVSAAYENGVLTVTLPKREAAKPRKVTVAVK